MRMQSRSDTLENAVEYDKDASRREKTAEFSQARNHRAKAITTAPPTMATTSRAMPAVGAAALPVCRPGRAELVSEPALVAAAGVITVTEVRVVKLPSGKVLVLLKVEVVRLVCEVCSVVWEEVDWLELDEEDEVLLAVVRVEGTLVVVAG